MQISYVSVNVNKVGFLLICRAALDSKCASPTNAETAAAVVLLALLLQQLTVWLA